MIQDPQNILLQTKSKITTNPFIPNDQQVFELETIEKEANTILTNAYNEKLKLTNMSVKHIGENISESFIGIINDVFAKPQNVFWKDYIPMILQKDQRYTYLGILIILIALYVLLVK